MKTKSGLLLAVVLISLNTTAQQLGGVNNQVAYIDGIKTLNVGDAMPEATLNKIINSSVKSAKISDFKDQLLIIDMWNTGCSGCVAALPKRDKLQKQFGNKIKIMPVTPEEESLVSKFWKTNKYTKDLTIPSVVEDRILYSYFKANYFYPQVWIYNGKVIGNTDPEYVDAYNIQQVLDGNIPNWPVKTDFYSFDGTKESLLKLNEDYFDANTGVATYAAISKYLEKDGASASGNMYNSRTIRDSVKKTVRFYVINQPIYVIYLLSWSNLIKLAELNKPWGNNANIWEVKNKSKYIYESESGTYRGDWMRKNAICFESVKPDTGQTDKEVYRAVIEDMNRLLGLNVRWEKRKEKVLVVVLTSNSDKIKSKASAREESSMQTQGTVVKWRNTSLSNIAWFINQQPGNPYAFDETNYKENIDIDLDVPSWTDIPALRKVLNQYGIDLKEEERIVDKLVFTEMP